MGAKRSDMPGPYEPQSSTSPRFCAGVGACEVVEGELSFLNGAEGRLVRDSRMNAYILERRCGWRGDSFGLQRWTISSSSD